jgi:hypothetical protein
MSEKMIERAKFKIGLREKIILLLLQVLLPFVLYLAINLDNSPLGIGAASLLALSMIILVVFG